MKKEREVVLSISILMSGRKETRMCLESLVPLMESIPCELILVDTGCDEDTRSILEEFTDIIIPFEWCNDFAKARNVGLERATGKWFMFLDDDECFEDLSEIIEFFQSGEYKKYRSALYKVRNFKSYDGTTYTEASVSRMTQLYPNTKFVNSIHEALNPLYGPVKLFETYVKHYGYIYNSQEELYSDCKRNLSLLKEETKNNPYDLRMAGLLLQEYKRLQEYDLGTEIAKSYLEKSNEPRFEGQKIDDKIGSFHAFILETHIRKYEYKECLEYGKVALKDKRINDVTRAFIYRTEVVSSYNLKDYDSVLKSFNEYIKLYDRMANNNEALYGQTFVLTSEVFEDFMYRQVVSYAMIAEFELGKEDILRSHFKKFSWDNEECFMAVRFPDALMTYILGQENSEDYSEYIEEIIKRKGYLGRVVRYVEDLEKKLDEESAGEESDDKEDLEIKFNRAVRVLAVVENTHWYFIYMSVLNYKNNRDKEVCIKNIKKLFACVVDIFNLNNKVWDILAEVEVPFEVVVSNFDFAKWKLGIERWIEHTTAEDVEYKVKLTSKWRDNGDLRYKYFDFKVKEAAVRYADKEDIYFEDYERKVFDFANAVNEYCVKVYNEEVFATHREVLPQEEILSLKLLELKNLRLNNSNEEVLKNIKDCVGIYEPFNEVIKVYVQKLGDYIVENDKAYQEQLSIKEELTQITDALKLKVREYIENGQLVEARVVLNQIIQCVPTDQEAKEILSMIE